MFKKLKNFISKNNGKINPILSIIPVIVLVVQTYIIYNQTNIMNNQTILDQRNNRAYMVLDNISSSVSLGMSKIEVEITSSTSQIKDSSYLIHPILVNSGLSIAKNVRFYSLKTFDTKQDLPPIDENNGSIPYTVPAGEKLNGSYFEINQKDVDFLDKGKKIYGLGRIEYEDIYGESRITEFCLEFKKRTNPEDYLTNDSKLYDGSITVSLEVPISYSLCNVKQCFDNNCN